MFNENIFCFVFIFCSQVTDDFIFFSDSRGGEYLGASDIMNVALS